MILILNYVEYDKRKAMEKIRERIGWVEYGDKHHESIYTRFYQTYILPKKFGVDKRRPHLSSLINNSEMSRDEGLSILQKPPLDEEQLEQDRRFVIKKLGLSEAEFERIMTDPPKSFWQYPNYENSPPLYDRALTRVVQWPGKVRALPRRMLSLAYRLALRPYRLVKRMLGRG
jgi:hypothetical protein